MPALLAATDPNWFYSTLAQSAAAIVGLVGAFLIQRILTVRSEIAGLRSGLRNDALALWNNLDSIRQITDRALLDLQHVREALVEIAADAREPEPLSQPYRLGRLTLLDWDGQEPRASRIWSSNSQTPVFYTEHRILEVDIAIQALRQLLFDFPDSFSEVTDRLTKGNKVVRPLKPDNASARALSKLAGAAPAQFEGVRSQPSRALVARTEMAVQAMHIDRGLSDLGERISVRSFEWLLAILAFLLVTSVIVPIGFLSDKPQMAKAWLLVPFAAGALGLLGYYLIELRRLASATDLQREHL